MIHVLPRAPASSVESGQPRAAAYGPALQNEAGATLLQGLAGGVLLLGAYFTWRQLQLSRQ
jgi:hypothetical protein